MSGGFRELENITADIGIEAWGPGLENAFSSTALGLASLISEPSESGVPLTREIRIESGSLPGLLVGFLNEIIYLQETEDILLRRVTRLEIRDNCLDASITGVLFDPAVHTLSAHIKAATYHGLTIDQSGERVTINVIFDV